MTIRKLAAGFLALTVLAGCSSTSSTSAASDATDNTAGEKEIKAKAIQTSAKLYQFGDTIEHDGIKYTLETAYRTDHSIYYTPEAGNKLVYCVMNVENTTDKPVTINRVEWFMERPAGYAPMPMDIWLQDPDYLTIEDLQPGESTSGYLVFEASPSTELMLFPPSEDVGTFDSAWLVQTWHND